MRIAFFVDVFPRLSETFILNQITGLIDRGHEVTIFAHNEGADETNHPMVDTYGLRQCVRYYGPFYGSIPSRRFQRLIWAGRLFLGTVSKHPGTGFRSLNIFRFGARALSMGVFLRAFPFLEDEPFDILFCHFGPNGILASFLREVGAVRGGLVTCFHGFDLSRYVRDQGREVYRDLFQKGDLFLPVSQTWRDKLVELGCPPDKTRVHRMGVSLDEYRSGSREKGSSSTRILTVARLTEKKGVEYGIRALAGLPAADTPWEYGIVGDGPLRSDLEALAEELRVSSRIRWLGWKTQDEVRDLMRESHVLLAPSVTASDGDQEGIPVVLMEAMALQLPVVSTWHSGIPELVQDGMTGFLVSERDVDALSERLAFLLDHPEKREEMGRLGRKRVETMHGIAAQNDRLVELFENLIHEKA